jgi:DNA-binding PadR family transcriptional regulator
MSPTATGSGLWELALLCTLREGPMHPYEIQRLLRARHKDEVLVLKRGSLYHAINRLLRERLIEAVTTERQGRRPERTIYRLIPAGQEALVRCLRQMIASPRREPAEFMGAVSYLIYLTPDDALTRLEERAGKLTQEITGLGARMRAAVPRVGRVNLLESEYLRGMRQAELRWVRGLVRELRSGRLTWSLEVILNQVRAARRKAER